MKLGLTHHIAFDFPASRRCYDEGFALWQRAAAGEPAATGPAPGPLRVHWTEPDVLDPALCTDIWSAGVIDQLFSALVQITPDMEVVPDAAERWEVCDDGRRYVFRLRDDMRWSDGIPVTAADFEFAWKRVLDPATGSHCAVMLFALAGARDFHAGVRTDSHDVGVRAIDDRTLVVDLEQPAAYLPYLLAYCSTYPVPRHVVAAHGSSWSDPATIVTNGPFTLQSWQPGRALTLRRDPNYHGRVRGNASLIELSLSAAGGAAAYEAGELDVLTLHDLPVKVRDRMRRDYADDYVSIPALFTTFAAFNATVAPFDDPRVRRALALAVDTEALADVVMGGDVFPATGGLNPVGMPGHAAGAAFRSDRDEARRLLAAAGYPDGGGFPAVLGAALGGVGLVADFLAESWARTLNIEVAWAPSGYRETLASRAASPVALMSWVADYPDPDNLLGLYVDRLLHDAGRDIKRLVSEAGRTTDQRRRMALYREADTALVGEALCLPLVYNRFQLLMTRDVRSLPMSASCFWFWKDTVLGEA